MSPTFKTGMHCVLGRGVWFSSFKSGSSEELLPESSHATWIIEFEPMKLKEGVYTKARTKMQHWHLRRFVQNSQAKYDWAPLALSFAS